jgi:hypothetical protein
MTSLNIGHVASDKQQLRELFNTDCPSCGAKKDKRIERDGFGPPTGRQLCGACGYEFAKERK